MRKSLERFFTVVRGTVARKPKLFTFCAIVTVLLTGFAAFAGGSATSVLYVMLGCVSLSVMALFPSLVGVVLFALLTVGLTSFAFMMGTYGDLMMQAVSVHTPLMWVGAHLTLVFVCLAVSYAMPSRRSRWMSTGVAQVFAFLTTGSLMYSVLSPVLAVVVGAAFGLTTFLVVYVVFRGVRHKKDKMPPVDDSFDLLRFRNESKDNGWEAKIVDDGKAVLVWKDRAYVCVPVAMVSPLAAGSSRRRASLTYQGNDIGAWLSSLHFKYSWFLKSRGSDISVVLLDTKNRNSRDPHAIMTPVSGKRANIVTAIVPAKARSFTSVMKDVEKVMVPWKEELSVKQRAALGDFGESSASDGPAISKGSAVVLEPDN